MKKIRLNIHDRPPTLLTFITFFSFILVALIVVLLSLFTISIVFPNTWGYFIVAAPFLWLVYSFKLGHWDIED